MRHLLTATIASLLTLGFLTPTQTTQAEEALVTVGKPAGLTLEPTTLVLTGKRARHQLLVTAKYASSELRDLTSVAAFTSSNPKVVQVKNGKAVPVGDGAAELTASVGGQKASIKVTVKDFAGTHPFSFRNEMLAALSKGGCNAGACHGSPSGKAGFRLSLRAFDPPLDILTLRHEYFGRRTNAMDPADSLVVKKAIMEVAHGGGKRIRKGDPVYQTFIGWIGEGLRLDAEGTPTLEKTELLPKKRVLQPASNLQQLVLLGHFSDGSVRDLTPLAVFTSSNESVGTVRADGLVEKTGRGETAVLARYLDKMTTSHVTFLENVEGFVWNNPKANNFVDEKVYEKLKQLQILPSELCTDEEFLRRAFIDTTGRLPRVDEVQAFLGDKAADKRAKLVNRLLDLDDFAELWALRWADILRSNSKKIKVAGVHKFYRWIYGSIRSDKPLDQFTRELITASGSVYENPAANYWRASRDPNDAVETTAQLFLGIRIQCAKCHNHPFERWTQDNYYGIAAAFTRIGRTKGARVDDEVIFPATSGEIKQPRTGKTMKVHLLLTGDIDVPDDQDRRVVFAKWLTSPDNPFFARASVNRIWGHLMGRGIVEPVDDFRDSNPPSNSKLLDELALQFTKNKFSRKWAIRTIMNSRIYQLSSRKNKFNSDDEIYNSHATTRLLSAEQLLDAICQVTDVPEVFKGVPPGTRAVALPEPPSDHYFLKIFGQPQREMACACERSNESNLSQALQMINGPVVHNKLRADNGRIAKMIGAKQSDEAIINSLYMAALARNPAAAEMAAAKKHIASSKDRRLALEDVGWAVLNSKEFLFQH